MLNDVTKKDGGKGFDLSDWEWVESVKKGIVHKHHILADSVFPRVNNSETITHVHWNWTFEESDGGCWEPSFSLLKWEAGDKHVEARMIPMLMN